MRDLRRVLLFVVVLLASFSSFILIHKKVKKDHLTKPIESNNYIQLKQMADKPDSTYLESEKMLSEGSQYGIHYYNELEQ